MRILRIECLEKEGFAEIHQVGNTFIGRISPPVGEFEAVARFLSGSPSLSVSTLDMVGAGGIAVVLSMSAI